MFDGIVVNGEEKMVKPNPEIYQLLLNRYHLQASESIFIDDRPANVEGANHVGAMPTAAPVWERTSMTASI